MAQPYVIDFTDPLKASFSIPPAGFNGPGGTQSSTTLRLYGRGAVDWGEATDENLVRLTENFFSGSAPINPIDGQLWRDVQLYWHNNTGGTHTGWYIYNLTAHTWGLLNGTGNVDPVPGTPTIGKHYYDSAAGILYRYDSMYKQQAASWIPRTHTEISIVPGTSKPAISWRVYSSAYNQWLIFSPASVYTAPAPGVSEAGSLYYNKTNNVLNVFNGTAYVPLGVSGSIFNMGGQSIINLPNQPYPQPSSANAATIQYINDGLASSAAGALGALGTGIIAKTGASTYSVRTLTPGSGILITNGSGVAGNPTITLDNAVVSTIVAGLLVGGSAITVEPISAGVPSNGIGANGDIRYQY